MPVKKITPAEFRKHYDEMVTNATNAADSGKGSALDYACDVAESLELTGKGNKESRAKFVKLAYGEDRAEAGKRSHLMTIMETADRRDNVEQVTSWLRKGSESKFRDSYNARLTACRFVRDHEGRVKKAEVDKVMADDFANKDGKYTNKVSVPKTVQEIVEAFAEKFGQTVTTKKDKSKVVKANAYRKVYTDDTCNKVMAALAALAERAETEEDDDTVVVDLAGTLAGLDDSALAK